MPTTIEALLIVLVFVMPGFITVRTREALVPSVGKMDALQVTLRSITTSLLYLPLWLFASPPLIVLREEITRSIAQPGTMALSPFHRGVAVFLLVAVILPVVSGVVLAIGYWRDWYPKIAERVYPGIGLRPPGRGVGDDLWDKLWLNRERERWLTVFLKDGRISVGRGVEFSQSALGRDLLLGGDSRLYDRDWNLVRSMSEVGGERVWIPSDSVVSIELYDPTGS